MPGLFPTVAGDHDATALQAHSRILPRSEVGVTAVAGKADERSGEAKAVSFGKPTGPANVLSGPVVVALTRRFAGEFLQALDSLRCDGHD